MWALLYLALVVLRYGCILIMAAQNYDGPRVRGLLIKFLHWWSPLVGAFVGVEYWLRAGVIPDAIISLPFIFLTSQRLRLHQDPRGDGEGQAPREGRLQGLWNRDLEEYHDSEGGWR